MRRVIQNKGKSSWKSHCVTCVLARLILYFWHVTGSWKGPISQNNPNKLLHKSLISGANKERQERVWPALKVYHVRTRVEGHDEST